MSSPPQHTRKRQRASEDDADDEGGSAASRHLHEPNKLTEIMGKYLAKYLRIEDYPQVNESVWPHIRKWLTMAEQVPRMCTEISANLGTRHRLYKGHVTHFKRVNKMTEGMTTTRRVQMVGILYVTDFVNPIYSPVVGPFSGMEDYVELTPTVAPHVHVRMIRNIVVQNGEVCRQTHTAVDIPFFEAPDQYAPYFNEVFKHLEDKYKHHWEDVAASSTPRQQQKE